MRSITATEIKGILKREYGITNEEEFNKTLENYKGIDIGIFASERRKNDDKSNSV